MSILARYFLRLYLPVFLLCLLVFAGVLMMNHFLKLFNMALMKGISPLWIAACFTRLLPFILSLALPMAFLVALLVTLGQLSESGEVTALRASGFSFAEMTWPFLGLGVVLSALMLYLNHKASPEGFHSFRNRYAQAAQQIARVDLEPRTMVRLGPWKLFARQADKETGGLEGVYLVRLSEASQTLRINAQRGRLTLDKARGAVLELEDGEIQLPNTEPEKYTVGRFRRYRLEMPLAGPLLERRADIQEMSSPTLRRLAQDPKTSAQHRVEYTVEVAVRSAAALSPFVFFWIAAPLGLALGRHSRGVGFALSLAILLGFYGLVATGIGLGRRHEALASLAPWLADAAGLALGAALTRRAAAR